jgi:hypothetical protein
MLWEILDCHIADLEEKWTKKYKKSINCSNPRGFSQRAHCAARRKRQKGGQTTSKSVSETGSPNQSQVTEIEITPEQQFGQDHILQRLQLATQQKNLIDGFEIYLYDENHTRLIAAWDDKNKQLAAAVVFQHMPKLRSRLYVAKNTEVFPQYQGQRLSGKLYKYCCEVLDMTIQSDMWQSASAKSLWTKTLPALGLHPQILDTTTNRTYSPDKIDPYKNNNHRYCWILEAHDNYPNHISEQSLIQPYRGIYASASQLLGITPSRGPESRMDALVETLLTQLTLQGLTEAQAVAHINGRLDEDLRKWFQQKWVRFGPDGKIRGACARGKDSEGKPKCLPQSKAHALGKKGRATAARRKRREDPNPEREGKARNVATRESIAEVANVRISLDPKDLGAYVYDEDPPEPTTLIPLGEITYVLEPDQLHATKPGAKARILRMVKALEKGKQLPPILVRKYQGSYQILDGHHRFKAYRMVNAKEIPARIVAPENITGDIAEQSQDTCPHCGGPVYDRMLAEKQDACYYKVKSRYKVWPSAYASGALVQCRKRGAKNWGKSKTNEAAPWLGQGDEPLPTKLYHVTRTRNRLSIRQRGLVPKTKEHKRVFRKPGVFGFETFEQAEDWAYYWSQDDRESMDIWEIDVEDTSDLTPDSAWDIQQDYDAWVIYKPIPAANVRLKFTQRWPEPRGKPFTTVKKIRNLEEDPNETE